MSHPLQLAQQHGHAAVWMEGRSDPALMGLNLDHPAHQWWRMTIRGLLARLRPALDLDYAADLLYLLLDPRTIHYQKLRHGYDDEAIAQQLAATAHLLVSGGR